MHFKYGPYSPSRLDTGVCGFAFHKQYVDPNRIKRTAESLPQARGSAVHEVFENITRRMTASEACSFSEAEIRQWVTEAVNRHPAAYEEVDAIINMAKLYVQKPPRILTQDAGIELKLAIKPKRLPSGEVETYVDERIQVPIQWDPSSGAVLQFTHPTRPVFVECDYDDPEAVARGRADIMVISDDTTTAIVYDHKTQPNVEEADTFQMGFYAWVISRIYPFIDEIHTILHFARYGRYSEPYKWTQEDLFKIEDAFLTRASIIESRTTWDAVPHSKCQYCPLLVQCPAMGEFIEVDENGSARVKHAGHFRILGDQSKAVKIAGLLNVLEEAVGTAKDELREYVKAGGLQVAIPGKIYEYRADEGINWDKVNKQLRDQAYAIFEKYGVDPKLFMSFNQTASKHIWMSENEALIKELAELFPRKTTTEFRGFKA